MQSTFHEEERRPRTVLRARPVTAEQHVTDEDRERVICAVIMALDPFPEAREAVLAALRSGRENGRDRLA